MNENQRNSFSKNRQLPNDTVELDLTSIFFVIGRLYRDGENVALPSLLKATVAFLEELSAHTIFCKIEEDCNTSQVANFFPVRLRRQEEVIIFEFVGESWGSGLSIWSTFILENFFSKTCKLR